MNADKKESDNEGQHSEDVLLAVTNHEENQVEEVTSKDDEETLSQSETSGGVERHEQTQLTLPLNAEVMADEPLQARPNEMRTTFTRPHFSNFFEHQDTMASLHRIQEFQLQQQRASNMDSFQELDRRFECASSSSCGMNAERRSCSSEKLGRCLGEENSRTYGSRDQPSLTSFSRFDGSIRDEDTFSSSSSIGAIYIPSAPLPRPGRAYRTISSLSIPGMPEEEEPRDQLHGSNDSGQMDVTLQHLSTRVPQSAVVEESLAMAKEDSSVSSSVEVREAALPGESEVCDM